VLFHRGSRGEGEGQQQEGGEQSSQRERHGWLSRGKSVSTVSGPRKAEYSGAKCKGRANARPGDIRRIVQDHLILDSLYSTCFLAIGSYFFFASLSVWVREFLRVT
jgi:hypothetical protein